MPVATLPYKYLLFTLLALVLVGCGGKPLKAPVEDRRIVPKSVPSSYSVRRGDTLYSIAWRFGLDHRSLAARNRIAAPYTIFPGQRIYLVGSLPPARKPASSSSKKPPPKPTVAKSSKKPSTKPVTTKPAVTKAAPPKPVSKANSKSVTVNKWSWPTTGKVTRGYSSSVHKGIDIAGQRSDPIRAVAAGKVVYAGTGIVGYGALIIVKHSELYLSAYGHNSRLLVAEGDPVRAGQKIAYKGSSGTDTVKLHFEIRKEGKPIDPMRLLPPR